jgi:hypothetical protein
MEFVRIVLGCIVGGYLAGILIDRFVCETIERRNGSGRYVFVGAGSNPMDLSARRHARKFTVVFHRRASKR